MRLPASELSRVRRRGSDLLGVLALVCATIFATASGCEHFDYQHKPTGFSSTRHEQVLDEKVRLVRARQEKRRRLAERRREQAEDLKQIANAKNSTKGKKQETVSQ